MLTFNYRLLIEMFMSVIIYSAANSKYILAKMSSEYRKIYHKLEGTPLITWIFQGCVLPPLRYHTGSSGYVTR